MPLKIQNGLISPMFLLSRNFRSGFCVLAALSRSARMRPERRDRIPLPLNCSSRT